MKGRLFGLPVHISPSLPEDGWMLTMRPPLLVTPDMVEKWTAMLLGGAKADRKGRETMKDDMTVGQLMEKLRKYRQDMWVYMGADRASFTIRDVYQESDTWIVLSDEDRNTETALDNI